MLLHVAPRSRLTVAPPSFALINRLPSVGETHIWCVSPCGTRTIANVLPPSIERCTCRFITYTTSAFVGSAVTEV